MELGAILVLLIAGGVDSTDNMQNTLTQININEWLTNDVTLSSFMLKDVVRADRCETKLQLMRLQIQEQFHVQSSHIEGP